MTKKLSWKALVEAAEFHDLPERETAYEFSNGREFERPEDPYAEMVQDEGE